MPDAAAIWLVCADMLTILVGSIKNTTYAIRPTLENFRKAGAMYVLFCIDQKALLAKAEQGSLEWLHHNRCAAGDATYGSIHCVRSDMLSQYLSSLPGRGGPLLLHAMDGYDFSRHSADLVARLGFDSYINSAIFDC